jgi:hypothetical protein
MNQYKDYYQVKSLFKQAFYINDVLDKYKFKSVLDIGTGPGIIKRVLVKKGKICHTVEQYNQWEEFKQFNPQIDFRMGYYKARHWELPVTGRYDCVVLSRFFNLHHTVDDFESVTASLKAMYSNNIIIFHNPKAWRLNTHVQSKAVCHNTPLWPLYVLQ